MKLALIVAVADNGVIGLDGHLPWRLKPDLRRFRELTTGHCIIMGRRTWESLGRPLPKRTNIVLSRQELALPPGVHGVKTLAAALALAEERGDAEPFVIGGAQIYALAMPLASRLYLTVVHAQVAGDVSLPPLNLNDWRLLRESSHPADAAAEAEYPYSYRDYER